MGQGDAIWIHTHDDNVDGNGRFEGYNIVIDGSPYAADSTNQLRPYLEDRGYHGAVIDALILRHPHNDHYNGAETISQHFHIRDYYEPRIRSRWHGVSGLPLGDARVQIPSSDSTIPDTPRAHTKSLSSPPPSVTGGQLSFLAFSGVSGLGGGRVRIKDEVTILRIRPISFAAC